MLIVDTSALAAALNVRETHHEACADVLLADDRPIVITPVLTETCSYLRRQLGARSEADFLYRLIDDALEMVELELMDVIRIAELTRRYEDLALGFVDAAIVAVAERLGATRIATLNYRDFGVVRPAHAAYLTLVPEATVRR
ncbi:type II toxin-antitoxin system VapC family toxin [Candidatus Poriferisodalis sp.]|uniref:type II toxin-antitoxin system VapC family toxin n=1 Tax=Candidatus Poriferisodalis sp. TaxID=3101277 RepID=UPI003B5C69D1